MAGGTSSISATHSIDLTQIHAESQLGTVLRTRYTRTGFLVDGKALRDFYPTPPGKAEHRAWVWQHGEAVTHLQSFTNYWLCRLCFDSSHKDHRKVKVIRTGGGTNSIRRHLGKHGYELDGTYKQCKRRPVDDGNIASMIKRQRTTEKTPVDRTEWRSLFLEYAVTDEHSLRALASERLKRLATYRQPVLEMLFPTSHNTPRAWIVDLCKKTLPRVKSDMATAISGIALSFDAWLADIDGGTDFLGVHAHYFDKDYQLKTVLIGLVPTYGNHTGEEQANILLKLIRQYDIASKLTYFMADNASNNDTTIEAIRREIPSLRHPHKCRLRCAGHFINLVVKAMLYGVDIECIDQACNDMNKEDEELEDSEIVYEFQRALSLRNAVDRQTAWRKKGCVGKLHNIVIHAHYSEARRHVFRSKQREADTRLVELVLNGGIKWQSDHDMIERGLELKDPIELYCLQFIDDLREDILTADDWAELKEILKLLKPLKMASLKVQADGQHFGGLWQSLTALESLLTTLEKAKSDHEHAANSHLKAIVNLGWKKLDKYYRLSDRTPAYRAAVALHPSLKMSWFEQHWGGMKDDNTQRKNKAKAKCKQRQSQQQNQDDIEASTLWTVKARHAIEELYNEYKMRCPAPTTRPATREREVDDYTASLMLTDTVLQDDLQRYLAEPLTPYMVGNKPINVVQWWRDNRQRYPLLSKLAFDLLATPASSSACEHEDRLRTITPTTAKLVQERLCVEETHKGGGKSARRSL
ncbi:hypothetical protein CKM354_000627100 [Cercospora kikuchii]|uniref:HAT C-terminal dimerisation domain-containing protein n=1 Tax=Cercospora kikuchii TaxID=84275 RepID=A0A9P3CKG0_9PEZI|nr:uncharacterized protein CKM354_000627100 [Cercospora kikuchii]GIZ43027.1 hypothetical protein CKM354_000627100 [Cercospora kikuchii]